MPYGEPFVKFYFWPLFELREVPDCKENGPNLVKNLKVVGTILITTNFKQNQYVCHKKKSKTRMDEAIMLFVS